jgi:hypothetical protein
MLAKFPFQRFNAAMPGPDIPLTRRRPADRQDCWHIYYGDVHAGTITMRAGNPHDPDPWEWSCGFYPGSKPGEIQSGTSATFEDARADFASAWKTFFAPQRGRFSGLALPARFNRLEIHDVGSRFQTADATAERPIKVLLRC